MTLTAKGHVGVRIDTSKATADDRLVIVLEDERRLSLRWDPSHKGGWAVDSVCTPPWFDTAAYDVAVDCLGKYPALPIPMGFTREEFAWSLGVEGQKRCSIVTPAGATSPDYGDTLRLRFRFRDSLITDGTYELDSPVKDILVVNVGAATP